MKKRLWASLLAVCLIVSMLPTTALAVEGKYGAASLNVAKELLDGDGTKESPFLIQNRQDLYDINAVEYWNNQQDKVIYYYQQTVDLDLTSTEIFDSLNTYIVETFRGVYDGQNHSISGMSKPLFYQIEGTAAGENADAYDGYVSGGNYSELYSAAICNLNLVSPTIPETYTTDKYTYAVAYKAKYASFVNITVNNATLTGCEEQNSQIGGLVGLAYWSLFDNCSISMTASKAKNIAGIAGRVFGSTATPLIMVNCQSSGTATMTGVFGGGMTFLTTTEENTTGNCQYELRIENCSSSMNISTTNSKGSSNDDGMVNIGGLVGRTNNSTLIQNCTYSGTLGYGNQGNNVYIGGIVGNVITNKKVLDGMDTWFVSGATLPVGDTSKTFYVGRLVGGYASERTLGWGYNTGSVYDAAGGNVRSISSGTTIGDIGSIRMITLRNVNQDSLQISSNSTLNVENSCNIENITFFGGKLLIKNDGTIGTVTVSDGQAWQTANSGTIKEIIYTGDAPNTDDYVIQVNSNSGSIEKISGYDGTSIVSYALGNGVGELYYSDSHPCFKAGADGTLPDVTKTAATGALYKFNGWKNGTSAITQNEDGTYPCSENEVYVPLWVGTITFDANGGTGSMDAQIFEDNSQTKLSTNAFSKDGYDFVGWNTKADGTGTSYTADAVASAVPNGTILYAQWGKKIGSDSYYVYPTIAVQTYTGSKLKPAVKVMKNGEEIKDGFTVEYNNNTKVGMATAVVKVGDTVIGTAAFEIIRATPTISITADKTNLTGSGTITLTVAGAPAEGAVSVTCDVDGINVVDNGDGTFSAVLPNETKTYTFTAVYTAATNGNYTDATPVRCTVSVTRRSSGSSISSASSYPVSAPSAKNGDVTVSPKSAKSGDTVTITVSPDKGYELDTIAVKDANGNTVTLTDNGNGKYTFTMPASKVTISAEFAEIQATSTFTDVPADAYYAEAVEWAVKNGITNGTSNTTFSPDKSCTRAEIVTFLWRAAGSPEPKGTSSFSDVSADSYYAKAVAWAVENGITGGTGDGKFSPDATCTREQAVTFLYRTSGSPAVSGGSAFSDVAADAYYASAVTWAEQNGVTGGIGDGLFGSGNDCTRAQIVTMLMRFYTEIVK